MIAFGADGANLDGFGRALDGSDDRLGGEVKGDAENVSVLVGDGDLWMMSTPYGKRGFFYESWAHGGAAWHRTEAKATENPRIRPEQLERERNASSAAFFEQDYLCRFVDGAGQLFGSELVEASLDDSVRALEI